MFVTIFDGRQHLQKCIADLFILCSIVIGSDRTEEITAAVEVEDEKISGEAAVDAVVTQAEVGIEGDCVGNVFVILNILLHVELLSGTARGLNTPGDHFNRDLFVSLGVFSHIDGA